MNIVSELFTIRSWTLKDIASLAYYANNHNIAKNMRDGFPHPYNESDAEKFITMALSMQPETFFAIDIENKAVGGIGFVCGSDVEKCSAEIGYWLGEPFWGKNIATTAVKLISDYIFSNFDIIRISAGIYSYNSSSIRVLEKAGFFHEARLKDAVVKGNILADKIILTKLSDRIGKNLIRHIQ